MSGVLLVDEPGAQDHKGCAMLSAPIDGEPEMQNCFPVGTKEVLSFEGEGDEPNQREPFRREVIPPLLLQLHLLKLGFSQF
jgi:hypothetical protein